MNQPARQAATLRVEAVVSGRLVASSRFRVLQHVAPLRRLGIEVNARPPRISKYAWLPPSVRGHRRLLPVTRTGLKAAKLAVRLPALARSWRADVTWLEREVLPGTMSIEPLLHRPLLFDVDDAIWLLTPGHDKAVRAIAARAACVVAGNDFLADWFSALSPHVERVWTAVDTDRFTPGPAPDSFVVGWSGSASTLPYLEGLAGALARFLEAAPDARLLVMADMRPSLPEVPPERVEFVPWRPDLEAAVLRQLAVGLMPLPDSDWGRGKCAFKMLQYLASAVPAVASPVGMGAQLLDMAEVGMGAHSHDDWVEALLALYSDRDRSARLGRTGRSLVERRFSLPVIAEQLAACMRRHA